MQIVHLFLNWVQSGTIIIVHILSLTPTAALYKALVLDIISFNLALALYPLHL